MSSLILKRASASRLRDGIERSNTLRAGKIDVLISLNYPSEGARLDVGPLRGALHRADRERLSAILTPPRSRPGAHDGEPEPQSQAPPHGAASPGRDRVGGRHAPPNPSCHR